MSGANDMMLNGDERAAESVPRLMAGTTDVVRPSSVAEPDDRLTPQSPIPMPVAGASGSAVLVGGDTVPAMPVIHLHRHEHAAGTVDEEARAVVDRLATQHGELFAYLHKEIEDLKKDALRQQFGKEVVAWADTARQEMGRLGLELRSLALRCPKRDGHAERRVREAEGGRGQAAGPD